MKLGPQSFYSYNRESVERGLTHHFGPSHGITNWYREGKGYVISTDRGLLQLKTLRETAIYVHGLAQGRRIEARAEKVA